MSDGSPHAALITGASRGIGRGVTDALAAAGFAVAISARGKEGLAATAEAARWRGAPSAVALPADLADPSECRELAIAAADSLGRSPDVFVHCAGIARNGAFGELPLADWETSMQVNVTSAFILASELAPKMAAAGWGRIVMIGSLYSLTSAPRTAAYTSSKHAVLGLTRVLAAEYVKRGVTANMLAPGFVDTEMVREEADRLAPVLGIEVEQVIQRFLRNQPLGRMVTVEEVGALVAYLCSEVAAPITGQSLAIDGNSHQG